ncbi:MAG TPA: nitroreductase family protein [Rhizomicrobium sp.]|nr:nitroreductase family protein [Rhizomicrobium sp.]
MSDSVSRLQARYGAALPPAGAWNETLDLLLAHRSVRFYLPESLPDGALTSAIAAAQSASTSSNLQVWSVIAVEDAARKARLAALAGNQAHVAKAPLLLVWLADLKRVREVSLQEGEKAEGLDYFEAFLLAAVDAALAAQNAALGLESLGLGCCYIGGLRNRAEEVAAELGLPRDVFALFGMTMGRPDPARPAPVKPRLPQQAVLFREQYQWDDAQRAAIALYNERLRAFQRSQGMTEQDWTAQAAKRVRDEKALTGRHVLRDFLNRVGFKLR